jgi:hypothetical protein
MWSNTAHAEDPGRFTFLGINECAPFEGVLFDPAATATILADRVTEPAECESRIKYEIELIQNEHQLEMQNLQIRHDALIQEYDMRIGSLERESDALAEALKKQTQTRPVLWAVVGFASGVAITYGGYRMFNE